MSSNEVNMWAAWKQSSNSLIGKAIQAQSTRAKKVENWSNLVCKSFLPFVISSSMATYCIDFQHEMVRIKKVSVISSTNVVKAELWIGGLLIDCIEDSRSLFILQNRFVCRDLEMNEIHLPFPFLLSDVALINECTLVQMKIYFEENDANVNPNLMMEWTHEGKKDHLLPSFRCDSLGAMIRKKHVTIQKLRQGVSVVNFDIGEMRETSSAIVLCLDPLSFIESITVRINRCPVSVWNVKHLETLGHHVYIVPLCNVGQMKNCKRYHFDTIEPLSTTFTPERIVNFSQIDNFDILLYHECETVNEVSVYFWCCDVVFCQGGISFLLQ